MIGSDLLTHMHGNMISELLSVLYTTLHRICGGERERGREGWRGVCCEVHFEKVNQSQKQGKVVLKHT